MAGLQEGLSFPSCCCACCEGSWQSARLPALPACSLLHWGTLQIAADSLSLRPWSIRKPNRAPQRLQDSRGPAKQLYRVWSACWSAGCEPAVSSYAVARDGDCPPPGAAERGGPLQPGGPGHTQARCGRAAGRGLQRDCAGHQCLRRCARGAAVALLLAQLADCSGTRVSSPEACVQCRSRRTSATPRSGSWTTATWRAWLACTGESQASVQSKLWCRLRETHS